MATPVNSAEVFKARLLALGIAHLQPQFERCGLTSVGAMAASCGYMPGASPDDSALVTGVIEPLLGTSDHQDVFK
eukprot:4163073-Amphidinium_carterae.1